MGLTKEQREAKTQVAVAEYELMLANLEADALTIGEEGFTKILSWLAAFPQRSHRNTMLIQMQYPGSTIARGSSQWYQHGRLIKKGEPGIAIWAPHTYIKEDEHGQEKQHVGFHITYVWDIEQTRIIDEDKARAHDEQLANPLALHIDADTLENELIAVANREGLTVSMRNLGPGHLGSLLPDQREIVLSESNSSSAERAAVISHELAHWYLDHQASARKEEVNRQQQEWEAECASWIVLQHHGIDNTDWTTTYLRSYNVKEGALKSHLSSIMKAVKRTLDRLEEVRLHRDEEPIAAD